MQVVGHRLPRRDAELQVQGKLLFTGDFKIHNMLYGAVLRSAEAHADIVSVDTREAESMEGVKAVITAEDVPNNRCAIMRDDRDGRVRDEIPILAGQRVRHRGDGIAAVAATSLEITEKALRSIKVVYRRLPAVFDPVEAMKPEAPKIHGEDNVAAKRYLELGQISKGFRDADLIVEDTFSTQMVEQAPLEPHTCIAQYEPDGSFKIWSTTQRPFVVASGLSRVLEVPLSHIRLMIPAVGGGFGSKNEMTTEPVACLLAKKSGRPVKIVFTREDEMTASTVRHPYLMTFKSGVKKDGQILARHVKIVSNTGPYSGVGVRVLERGIDFCTGPYQIPNVFVEGYVIYTNVNKGGAMRGFGVPQVIFACEVHMDRIARELGMDPLDLRLRNALVDGSTMATGQILKKSTLTATLETAIKRVAEN